VPFGDLSSFRTGTAELSAAKGERGIVDDVIAAGGGDEAVVELALE
jgi:hypothetical protein